MTQLLAIRKIDPRLAVNSCHCYCYYGFIVEQAVPISRLTQNHIGLNNELKERERAVNQPFVTMKLQNNKPLILYLSVFMCIAYWTFLHFMVRNTLYHPRNWIKQKELG